MKRKIKFFININCALAFALASCGSSSMAYEKYGCNAKVIYNLGDAVFDPDNKNTHELVFQYMPDSFITDFTGDKTYVFNLTGYELSGWYFDAEFQNQVDFTTYKTQPNSEITLYAKWVEQKVRYFDVYYFDSSTEQNVLLKSVEWSVGEPFDIKTANISYPGTDTHTLIDVYQDAEMNTLLSDSYVLTSNDDSLSIYTKWVEGDFVVVKTANEFNKYFGLKNIYLYNDIDFNYSSKYVLYSDSLENYTILGNGYKLKNVLFTTFGKENGSKTTVTLGLLAATLKNSTIKDLEFTDVKFNIKAATCSFLRVGMLAGNIEGSTIDNVSMTGTVIYDEETVNRLGDNLRVLSSNAGYVEETSTITNCTFTINDERK